MMDIYSSHRCWAMQVFTKHGRKHLDSESEDNKFKKKLMGKGPIISEAYMCEGCGIKLGLVTYFSAEIQDRCSLFLLAQKEMCLAQGPAWPLSLSIVAVPKM
jgi:hypothetical protein